MATATEIKELREKTGAGFLECKKALEQSQNDVDKAISYLRERGMAAAGKKAGRAANEGRIHSYIHGNGKLGVLVEVNCETDFVAATEEFKALVHDIAMHIAAASPRFLNKESVPAEELEKEKDIFRTQAANSGKPAAVIEKIVDGKINKFYEEVCLLNQPFVKDPDKNIEMLVKEGIAKLGENIAVRRFTRYLIGEGAKT